MPKHQQDMWAEERATRDRGFEVIAGVDEAGRGPLAGPVVAAAVVLPFGLDLPGVRDSKTLSPAQRDRAYLAIQAAAHGIGVGVAGADEIDSRNILRASHEAMRRAVAALPLRPDIALIDGLRVAPFPVPQVALIKGDGRSLSVAAASVVAKVTRDRAMVELDAAHPGYGFAIHKGYPTPEHLDALERLGPCPIHRRSFAPVAALLGQPTLPLAVPERQRVGAQGEAVAAAHLRRLGWQILATRYRCREGEIDIVARDREVLVFVEVKARHGRDAAPAEAVHGAKQARVSAAARAYMHDHALGDECACRYDVAEVLFNARGTATVRLICGAFDAIG